MGERKTRISDVHILDELAKRMTVEGIRVSEGGEVDWHAPQGPATLTDEVLTNLFSQVESIVDISDRETAKQDVMRGLNLRFGVSTEQLNERLSALKR